ncbi:MAG TPA: transporter substrate-binding domain-containing protein [Jiangellaceae bacterium]
MKLTSSARTLSFVLAAAALAISGCGGDDDDDDTTAADDGDIQLIQEGKLTVCTHLPYEPFQYQDESGEVVGFDVDLLDLLAEDLGVEQEILNVGEWEQVTSGAVFAANRCDIGMGAMTITEERAEALHISDPYFDATQALIVQTGSGIEGLEDLEGELVGVQTGTTGQDYGEANAEEFGYTTQNFEDLALQLNALKAGQIAAAINDNVPILSFVEGNPDTEMVTEFDTGEQYGFPAKKDDPNAEQLIARLNELLAQAFDDGTYDEIYEKWFGVKPGETNGD